MKIVRLSKDSNLNRIEKVFKWTRFSGRGPAGATGPVGATGATGATGAQGDPGEGVPVGGTTGQILKKQSATDFDTDWEDESVGSTLKISSIQNLTDSLGSTAEFNPFKASNHTSYVENTNWKRNLPDNGIVFDSVNGDFTVSSSDNYEISTGLIVFNPGATEVLVKIKVNGTSRWTGRILVHNAVDPILISPSIPLSLNVNDIVTVTIEEQFTGNIIVNAASYLTVKSI